MNPERYQRVFEIFIGVCDLPPDERGPALDRICGEDVALRGEVETFLEIYVESEHDVRVEIAASQRTAEHERLQSGTIVGNFYRVDAWIGEGGMSAVYRATDLRDGTAVALKVVRGEETPEAGAIARESLAISRLAHPNIVNIREFGEEPGLGPYLVMELLRGRTLDEEIGSRGRFELVEGLAIMRPILDAVDAAHTAGVIHRDLKPQNIILEPIGAAMVVKVLDFGLAKILDPNTVERGIRSISGMLAGTPHFMSPEQCEGRPLDARSDVYSLGCILFVLFTGRPPFDGDSLAAVLLKHLDEEPRPASDFDASIPPEIDAVIVRALSKKPTDRHASVAHMRAELARAGMRIRSP
jgi:serine/threonine protein kinase